MESNHGSFLSLDQFDLQNPARLFEVILKICFLDALQAFNVMVDAPPSYLNLIEKFTVGVSRRSLSFDLVPSELKRNLICTVSMLSLKFNFLVTHGSIGVSRFGEPDVTKAFIEASDLISGNFGRSDRSIILKVRVKILILPIFWHAFHE